MLGHAQGKLHENIGGGGPPNVSCNFSSWVIAELPGLFEFCSTKEVATRLCQRLRILIFETCMLIFVDFLCAFVVLTMCLFDAFLVVESLRQLIAESSGTEGVSDGVLEARGVVEWEWTFGYRRLPCFLTKRLHILGFHRILCQKLCSIDV